MGLAFGLALLLVLGLPDGGIFDFDRRALYNAATAPSLAVTPHSRLRCSTPLARAFYYVHMHNKTHAECQKKALIFVFCQVSQKDLCSTL